VAANASVDVLTQEASVKAGQLRVSRIWRDSQGGDFAKLRSVLSVPETTRNGMLVISFGDITGKGMMYHEGHAISTYW